MIVWFMADDKYFNWRFIAEFVDLKPIWNILARRWPAAIHFETAHMSTIALRRKIISFLSELV